MKQKKSRLVLRRLFLFASSGTSRFFSNHGHYPKKERLTGEQERAAFEEVYGKEYGKQQKSYLMAVPFRTFHPVPKGNGLIHKKRYYF